MSRSPGPHSVACALPFPTPRRFQPTLQLLANNEKTPCPLTHVSSRTPSHAVPFPTPQLLANNEKTYWVPSYVKEKRFHNWLENARDWVGVPWVGLGCLGTAYNFHVLRLSLSWLESARNWVGVPWVCLGFASVLGTTFTCFEWASAGWRVCAAGCALVLGGSAGFVATRASIGVQPSTTDGRKQSGWVAVES